MDWSQYQHIRRGYKWNWAKREVGVESIHNKACHQFEESFETLMALQSCPKLKQ